MKTIQATYRIVTPMFIGGANQDPSDAVRPPSFKGALRFWWRALNWGRLRQAAPSDADALEALHREEVRLFGGSAEQGGQGLFLLRVVKQPAPTSVVHDWPVEKSKSGYMGLGLIPMGEHLRRGGIREGQSFSVELLLKADARPNDITQIKEAMHALGLLGGLGSRNRKGFGSIALEVMDGMGYPCRSVEAYAQQCAKLLPPPGTAGGLPPFSALSGGIRLGLLTKGRHADARSAHSALAALYASIRGRGGVVKGKKKIAFGIPLKDYAERENIRRASPLLMHIHPVGDHFLPSCLFLPAVFHPDYPAGQNLAFYAGVERFMDALEEV